VSPAPFELVEVAPRDGLQDHPGFLPTADKVELVRRVLAAGVRRVEVTGFAHPDRVPALADAEAVLAALGDVPDDVRLSALVLNERGLDRALACSVREVTMVVVATDAFSVRNQGMSTADAVAAARRITTRAAGHGVAVGVTVAAAFGCPYEGPVAPGRVLDLVGQLAEAGPCEVVLADTIGTGRPQDVAELVTAVATRTGLPVRGHFHNTHGRALDNALAALDAGAYALDGSLSGLGGCPSAPGSEDRGNLASEAFAAALAQRGLPGPDPDALAGTARWLRTRLAATTPDAVAAAGRG
jgi:hydroxymethylglutaryl-CoA lyase